MQCLDIRGSLLHPSDTRGSATPHLSWNSQRCFTSHADSLRRRILRRSGDGHAIVAPAMRPGSAAVSSPWRCSPRPESNPCTSRPTRVPHARAHRKGRACHAERVAVAAVGHRPGERLRRPGEMGRHRQCSARLFTGTGRNSTDTSSSNANDVNITPKGAASSSGQPARPAAIGAMSRRAAS